MGSSRQMERGVCFYFPLSSNVYLLTSSFFKSLMFYELKCYLDFLKDDIFPFFFCYCGFYLLWSSMKSPVSQTVHSIHNISHLQFVLTLCRALQFHIYILNLKD